MIRTVFTAFCLFLAATSGKGSAQVALDQQLGRPFALLLDNEPPGVRSILGALDRPIGALRAPQTPANIFDVDVYAVFMDGKSGATLSQDNPMRDAIIAELSKVEPESGLNMLNVKLTRNSDGTEKTLPVITIDMRTTRDLSYLCLAVAVYDISRWQFSSPDSGLAFRRFRPCHEARWTRVEQAF